MKKFGLLFLVLSIMLPLKSWASDYVPGEFLVGMKEGASLSALETLNAQFGVYAAQKQAGTKGLYVLKVPPFTDIMAAVAAYKAVPSVRLAEPNFVVKASQNASLNRASQFAVKQADLSAGLAIAQPAVFFDHAGSRQDKIIPVAVCTPGVDPGCRAVPSQPKPKPKSPASCTPGVDPGCGGVAPSKPKNPSCTPGVDADCGQRPGNPGSGETPAPPNYRKPRPDYPTGIPRQYPRRRNPIYDSDRVISGGSWRPVTDYGRYIVDYSGWHESPAYATINRSGANQPKEFLATLTTMVSRRKYQLYWRWVWVGTDCDYAGDNCAAWRQDVEDAWGYEGLEYSPGRSIQVQLNFANDSALLPWETESISLSYDGSQVGYGLSGAAFHYNVTGPLIDQFRGRAFITLTAGSKKLQNPDRNGVDMWLENISGKSGNTIQVKFRDKHVPYYRGEEGEVLEFQVTIKKKVEGGFDPVVFKMTRDSNGVWQWRLWGGNPVGGPFDTFISQPGEYYISDWEFRRANVAGDSKVSKSNWVDKGRGAGISR